MATDTKLAPISPTNIAKLEDWELTLQSQAKAALAGEAAGMLRVTHQGGRLAIDGVPLDKSMNNTLVVGIIDYIFIKGYRAEEGFDADNPTVPCCYAFGLNKTDKGMIPNKASPDPQSEACDTCPHNQFHTAGVGRGKRCRDGRRLAVIVEHSDPGSILKAEVRQLEVPPDSLKNAWGKYLISLLEVTPTGSPVAVLTEIGTTTVPGKGGYRLTFRCVGKLDREAVKAIIARQPKVLDMLTQPYPEMALPEKPAKPAAVAKARKKLG